ncbi:hypothetical protein JTB14_013626 [Gonioctena quinquepunctata]|nr:hypothetical protein JTB14_013626 [Gonioctena quinquepunctata]
MWRRVLLLAVPALVVTNAHLNFFITEDEVLKLLGINAELFYVHKGVVNTYALNFVVMIPSHINEIQFSWQSLVNYSVSRYSPFELKRLETVRDIDNSIIYFCIIVTSMSSCLSFDIGYTFFLDTTEGH